MRQPIRTHNLIAHSQIQPHQHSQSNCLKCLKIDFRFFTYPRWRFFPCWWVCFAICILKITSVNICTCMLCRNILALEFNFIAPIWVPSMLQFFILLHLQLINLSHVLTFNYRCKGDPKNQRNWIWDWFFFLNKCHLQPIWTPQQQLHVGPIKTSKNNLPGQTVAFNSHPRYRSKLHSGPGCSKLA